MVVAIVEFYCYRLFRPLQLALKKMVKVIYFYILSIYFYISPSPAHTQLINKPVELSRFNDNYAQLHSQNTLRHPERARQTHW